MKFKKIAALAVAFVMTASVSSGAKTLEFKMGSLYMNESDAQVDIYLLENAPYTKNDRTMVPVRIISERFGAQVGWNEEHRQISITKDDMNIILTLDNMQAMVNGEPVELDVAPEEFNGRTMIPLRFISETLGKDVRYIASTEQVVITDNEPLLTINETDISIDHYRTLMLAAGYKEGSARPIDYVSQITALLKEVYGAGTTVLAEGKYQLGTYAEEINEAIEQNAVYMRESEVLSYPMAEYWDYENLIYNKAEDYLDAEKTEADAEEFYNNSFVTAKHILVLIDDDTSETEAKKKADEILAKIKKGEDFDKLVDAYNEDPGVAQNPDGYTFTRGEMVSEFEEMAFALEVGEISEPVKTSYGYHILKKEPLAPITDEIKNNIIYYFEERSPYLVVAEAMESAQITVHKTDEEIAAMFK